MIARAKAAPPSAAGSARSIPSAILLHRQRHPDHAGGEDQHLLRQEAEARRREHGHLLGILPAPARRCRRWRCRCSPPRRAPSRDHPLPAELHRRGGGAVSREDARHGRGRSASSTPRSGTSRFLCRRPRRRRGTPAQRYAYETSACISLRSARDAPVEARIDQGHYPSVLWILRGQRQAGIFGQAEKQIGVLDGLPCRPLYQVIDRGHRHQASRTG